jgi:hypothetical protein
MTYGQICAASSPQRGLFSELMTSAWVCAIGWLREKSSLTSCRARCEVFVSFEISSGGYAGTIPRRRIHVRMSALSAAERRLNSVRLDLYGASIPSLQSLLDENRTLTHIDVLIVPSIPLHFPSCLLRIMERGLTALTSSAESLTFWRTSNPDSLRTRHAKDCGRLCPNAK